MEKPASLCDNCTAWQAFEPLIAEYSGDPHRSLAEELQRQDMQDTAENVGKAAEAIGCRQLEKALPNKPVGALAVGSKEFVVYASTCPAFNHYISNNKEN